MRARLLFLIALLMLNHVAPAQNRPRQMPAPTILLGPTDWRFEHLPIPPGFARDIKWQGFEEARFSPGMFDTNSNNHFTYVLVVSLEDTPEVGAAELKGFLGKYFKGLSSAIGQRKQIKVDYDEIKAEVKAAADAKNRYEAKVPFFDTFNDGRKISLNIDATVIPKSASGKTYLTLLISPKPREAEEWKKLRSTVENLKLAEK